VQGGRRKSLLPFLVMTGRNRARAGNQELVGLAIGRCHDDGTLVEALFAFETSREEQTDRRYNRADLTGQVQDIAYSVDQIWSDIVAFAGSDPVVVEQESTWRAFRSDSRWGTRLGGHEELQFLGLTGLEHLLDAGKSASTPLAAVTATPTSDLKTMPVAQSLYQAALNLAGRYVTWLEGLHALPHPTLEMLLAASDPMSPRYVVVQDALMRSMAGGVPLRGDQKLIDGLVFRSAPQKLAARPDQPVPEVPSTSHERSAVTDRGQPQPAPAQAVDLASRSIALLEAAFASPASGNPLERRAGQTMMMRAVANGLESGGHVIVEAGTGTGKSLAYLLPAAIYAREHGERVVVATHTTALQEQLRTKDLALLHAGAQNLVRTAILKGRNNYLCLRKLAARVRAVPVLAPNEQNATLTLAVWVGGTETGDREEVALLSDEQPFWTEVQSDTDSCIHKRCSFFRDCYYFRAKAAAASADIVVTNHSLILSDMGNDYGVLPPYEHLIIDEAHHLEDQATAQLGAEVTEYLLRRTLETVGGTRGLAADLRRTIAREIAQGQEQWQSFVALLDQVTRHCVEVDRVFTEVAAAVTRWIGATGEAAVRRIDPAIVQHAEYDSVTSSTLELVGVHKTVDTTSGQLQALRSEIEMTDDSLFGRFEDVSGELRKLSSLLAVIGDVLLARSDPEAYVGWVAVRSGRTNAAFSMHLAPLSVAKILRSELFDQKSSVICTSATLAVDADFTYFAERTGLSMTDDPNPPQTVVVPSPFHYKEQAVLCVVTDLADVRSEGFLVQAGHAITQLARDAGGRTLVLFTSHQMMQAVYRAEQARLSQAGLRLLAQGMDDHRRSRLVETFRTGERAVLFGVNSFWEGIDIRGDDLSCLIIVKLPFAVPSHPVVQARSERLQADGKDPFRDYSVPQAVIRFTQGFGRLIRSEHDRGAVFVLDKRIVTTSYGRLFLRSLPHPKVVVGPLQTARTQAREFFSV